MKLFRAGDRNESDAQAVSNMTMTLMWEALCVLLLSAAGIQRDAQRLELSAMLRGTDDSLIGLLLILLICLFGWFCLVALVFSVWFWCWIL